MKHVIALVVIVCSARLARADGPTEITLEEVVGTPNAGDVAQWGVGVYHSYQEFADASRALTSFDENCIDTSSLSAPAVPASCADDAESSTNGRRGGTGGTGGTAGTNGTGVSPGAGGSTTTSQTSGGTGPTSDGGLDDGGVAGGNSDQSTTTAGAGGGGGGGGATGGAGGAAGAAGGGRGGGGAAGGRSTGSCGECYQHATHQLNGMRLNLERLRCTYSAYSRYVKAAIALGDTTSGIHAVTGLAWQNARADIVAEFEHLKQAYDHSYAGMMPNLKAALEAVGACEAQHFNDPDWYGRFGFIYYTFMSDRYRRAD